jgi:molecular chaperone Hsp33
MAHSCHTLSFHLDHGLMRGRIAYVDQIFEELCQRHDYPQTVQNLLGEAVVLTCILASTVKYDGIFTLQIKGDAAITRLVCDVTSQGDVRACATFDSEKLAHAETTFGANEPTDRVPHFIGGGYLAFTVDQGPQTDRYQGLVALEGGTLSECAQKYFQQSEQLDTAIHVRVQATDGAHKCRGVLIQKMPGLNTDLTDEELDDYWRTAVILLGSLKDDELQSDTLTPTDILYRLYHDNALETHSPIDFRFKCRCSREKVRAALATVPQQDLRDMGEEENLTIHCDFCGTDYIFSIPDLLGE